MSNVTHRSLSRESKTTTKAKSVQYVENIRNSSGVFELNERRV